VSTLQARVDRSTAWVAVASFVLGMFDLLSTLICLRIGVSTAEFGDATLAIALFPLLDRLGGSGLGAAIVQELGGDRDALSTVFWVGVVASGTLFGLLALARPVIATWLPTPIIASLLVAYAGRLVVQQLGTVPDALLRRELRYFELSIVRVIAGGVDTATKLGLAYLGVHGVPALRIWCFALGPIAAAVTTTIGVQVCESWRPRLSFRRTVAARAIRFTAAISGGELLYFAYTSADYLVVAAWFGDVAVGAYRLAYELVLDVVRLVSMVTAEVAFPTFARLADEAAAVGAQLLRFTRQNLVVLAPFLVFILVEADDLLALLYPPLPREAALTARVLCAVGTLRTLGFMLPPLLAGLGLPGRVLVYNVIASVALPLAFVIGALAGHDFVAVAWAWAIGYPLAFIALLAMTLPKAQISLAAYTRALSGVAVCAAGALGLGVGTRALFDPGALRAGAVAIVVLASYLLLLAKVEHITPASIVRGFARRA
jgi:PST family polysaccharide transporter/lipopolysaccharide exporter